MKQVKKHIGIRIFLLALFIGYFAGITFFTHSHIINGVTIIHSHFSFPASASAQDSKSPGHTHTANSLTLIANATVWTVFLQQTPTVPENAVKTVCRDYPPQIISVPQARPATLNLRGPPVSCPLFC